MGARGPAPKRSTERRRRNKESKPTKGKSGSGQPPKPPKADKDWHPVAKMWYESLAKSGQVEFYEHSDWSTAYLIAESISRDLNPQYVALDERTGEPVYETIPMKGASLSAYLKAMGNLLVTEGDRRRAKIELERAGQSPGGDEEPAGVTAIADYRKRVGA